MILWSNNSYTDKFGMWVFDPREMKAGDKGKARRVEFDNIAPFASDQALTSMTNIW
jgi:hypothetical protein